MAKTDLDNDLFDDDAELYASYDVYKTLIEEGFEEKVALKKSGLTSIQLKELIEEDSLASKDNLFDLDDDELDIHSEFKEEYDKGGASVDNEFSDDFGSNRTEWNEDDLNWEDEEGDNLYDNNSSSFSDEEDY